MYIGCHCQSCSRWLHDVLSLCTVEPCTQHIRVGGKPPRDRERDGDGGVWSDSLGFLGLPNANTTTTQCLLGAFSQRLLILDHLLDVSQDRPVTILFAHRRYLEARSFQPMAPRIPSQYLIHFSLS